MNRLRKVLGKGGERKGPLTGKALEIGTYQVEVGAVLGEGGFATVYRALDVNTERSMALKHFRLRQAAWRRRMRGGGAPPPLATLPHSCPWLPLPAEAAARPDVSVILVWDGCSGDPEAERDVHAEVRIMKALQVGAMNGGWPNRTLLARPLKLSCHRSHVCRPALMLCGSMLWRIRGRLAPGQRRWC